MSRSSDRAQVEPLAALAAVAVVGTALTLHAGVLHGVRPPEPTRDRATPALQRALGAVRDEGLARPSRLRSVSAPDGRAMNVTLRTANRTWAVGPRPPDGADRAGRPVPVRVAPGAVRAGRLRVAVWNA